ncbi:hypothetical protein EVAR_17592_1 [Eumeta japonica]|uniref:Uncharacterized protein n=1 Tax=Eumeta variegata TaxID=151549 RepID=A0A4C1UBU1_EUMVA|nr:hypothetical protein EVAR_17592_1 [Eumeta japonica]
MRETLLNISIELRFEIVQRTMEIVLLEVFLRHKNRNEDIGMNRTRPLKNKGSRVKAKNWMSQRETAHARWTDDLLKVADGRWCWWLRIILRGSLRYSFIFRVSSNTVQTYKYVVSCPRGEYGGRPGLARAPSVGGRKIYKRFSSPQQNDFDARISWMRLLWTYGDLRGLWCYEIASNVSDGVRGVLSGRRSRPPAPATRV